MAKNAMSKIPTPLEGLDAVGDVVNQVARAPLRIIRNIANAVGSTAGKLERDIAVPAESAETPPTPDQLARPAVNGVEHILSGVKDVVTGAIDGVTETGRGMQREIDQVTK